MILKTYIKPTILEGNGTTKDAIYALESHLRYAGAMRTYGTLGDCYTAKGIVYVYNIEVYKRKKNRHNAHYKVFIYRISENWVYDNKKKVIQRSRFFRIIDKNKPFGKLSKY